LGTEHGSGLYCSCVLLLTRASRRQMLPGAATPLIERLVVKAALVCWLYLVFLSVSGLVLLAVPCLFVCFWLSLVW
jgi:hypothetical protein